MAAWCRRLQGSRTCVKSRSGGLVDARSRGGANELRMALGACVVADRAATGWTLRLDAAAAPQVCPALRERVTGGAGSWQGPRLAAPHPGCTLLVSGLRPDYCPREAGGDDPRAVQQRHHHSVD